MAYEQKRLHIDVQPVTTILVMRKECAYFWQVQVFVLKATNIHTIFSCSLR